MKLVFPNIEYKEKAIDYINEFYAYSSKINGDAGLDKALKASSYEEWINQVIAHVDIANVPEGRAPSLTYFYVREEDDKIIGMIDLRLSLNDFLRTEGGHIGYAIRPTERRKGYATVMLKDALNIYRTLGIYNVLVVCNKENVASAKVIQNCGGIIDEEFFSERYKKILQRYIIKLK